MIMYCRYCGEPLPDDSQYCEFCGKQINDSHEEESSVSLKKEIVGRCRVCGKILYDNETRISLETGGVMCEDCAIAFQEESIKPEDIELEEEESEFIPKDVLDVINNKEDYTYEKLNSTLIWLKENEYIDETNSLEMYINQQQKNKNSTEGFLDGGDEQIDVYEEEIDDEICEDSNLLGLENEKRKRTEIEIESNFDKQNKSDILQKQFGRIDVDDLKEYLDIVVNMEKNIYLQNSLISQMKERYAQLGQAHIFNEPTAPNDSSGWGIMAIILSGGMAFIGFILIRCGLQLCSASLGEFLLGLIVLVFGGDFLIGGIILAICLFAQVIKDREKYSDDKRAYDIAYAKYDKNIRIDKKRVCKEKLEKKVLSLEIRLLQKQNEDSKRNLEQIYTLNIIFPKYRNLVMLCSIYEYICAGRCTTLEGHEGAYNILEMEIRLDRIITQLDLVIAQLNVIRNNQYMLYSAIQETNQQITQILKSTNYVMDSLQNFQGQAEELVASIKSVEKNTMLATYQAESIQKELHYMNRMNYLSGKYKNVFYNAPPS